jgi:hypothetical protein
VLSAVEWDGEPHSLWYLPLPPGIARAGVLIELVGAG